MSQGLREIEFPQLILGFLVKVSDHGLLPDDFFLVIPVVSRSANMF